MPRTQLQCAVYWNRGAWIDMLLGNRDRAVAGFVASSLAWQGWWAELWK